MQQLLNDPAMIFWFPAILGTTVFVLRMVMLLMGGDSGDFGADADLGGFDAGMDAGFDGELSLDGLDANSEPIDHGGTNSDSAFRIISLQTIAAFLMGAGWGGLGAYKGAGLSVGWSVAVSLAIGVFFLYVFAWLMKALYDMQSSGNITAGMILGREATVDVEVPSSRMGQGTIKIIIDERERRYRAFTEGQTIPRGTAVRIEKINSDNTVTVARA